MNDIEKALFLQAVENVTTKDPFLLRPIVDHATAGVKQYADSQRDMGSQAQFKLFCVLDAIEPPKDGKFGPFPIASVLDCLDSSFGGTKGLEALRAKYGVAKPEDKPEDQGSAKGWVKREMWE